MASEDGFPILRSLIKMVKQLEAFRSCISVEITERNEQIFFENDLRR